MRSNRSRRRLVQSRHSPSKNRSDRRFITGTIGASTSRIHAKIRTRSARYGEVRPSTLDATANNNTLRRRQRTTTLTNFLFYLDVDVCIYYKTRPPENGFNASTEISLWRPRGRPVRSHTLSDTAKLTWEGSGCKLPDPDVTSRETLAQIFVL